MIYDSSLYFLTRIYMALIWLDCVCYKRFFKDETRLLTWEIQSKFETYFLHCDRKDSMKIQFASLIE